MGVYIPDTEPQISENCDGGVYLAINRCGLICAIIGCQLYIPCSNISLGDVRSSKFSDRLNEAFSPHFALANPSVEYKTVPPRFFNSLPYCMASFDFVAPSTYQLKSP